MYLLVRKITEFVGFDSIRGFRNLCVCVGGGEGILEHPELVQESPS